MSLANVVAMAHAARQHRAARRPAAARPAACRAAPAGRRPLGARPRARRRRDDAARPRACSSRDLAAAPGPLRVHVRGVLRRPARARAASRRPALRCATSPSLDGVGPRLRRGRARRAPTTSRPRRPTRSRRSPDLVEGGTTWTDATGRSRGRSTLGRRPHRRAVQRPGRRHPAARCRRRRGSAPSTSSRARRRRSASTR